MNQKTALAMWDHLRQMNGINMRLIAELPADRLDSHPIPNMRTPKELTVHMYDLCIKGLAEGLVRGEIIDTESAEKTIAAGIRSRDDLVKFARDCWGSADRSMATVTDAHLSGTVKTPWPPHNAIPGSMVMGIISDEFLHHRGQLYAYVRALGGTPPNVWDFANNTPEFQPKANAKA
jgi:uncharacterized damage-inducible protein DinB